MYLILLCLCGATELNLLGHGGPLVFIWSLEWGQQCEIRSCLDLLNLLNLASLINCFNCKAHCLLSKLLGSLSVTHGASITAGEAQLLPGTLSWTREPSFRITCG